MKLNLRNIFYLIQDHPRMCGKDKKHFPGTSFHSGSPPHVRERLVPGWNSLRELGITPACAGKTRHLARPILIAQDHPRMCGKDSRRLLGCKNTMWITPACAGKTVASWSQSRRAEDHPRMCGKDFVRIKSAAVASGSPPHVRERPVFFRFPQKDFRITPACAGKTQPD